ncbi:ferritin-like domain-containing protein [Pararhizobium arenae]|uniref:ferritin-like domain-containing protein n=1 Tax=Pararhizobium arenae TaxID=1856850 RepID=UPI00094B4932|nr:ferritin-like domain-containing protein [Pararhizobium arenae]
MPEDTVRSIFVTGLKNAHAMENQALSIMKPQVSRIEHYPEVAARLDQHIRETENQIARLDQLLSEFAEDRSAIKDIALSVTGAMAAMGHTVAGDEILKNSFANYAFEHFEIAAYRSLLTIAEQGGFSASTAALRVNLDEEVAMAGWIEQHLSDVTLKFLSLKSAGETAKV